MLEMTTWVNLSSRKNGQNPINKHNLYLLPLQNYTCTFNFPYRQLEFIKESTVQFRQAIMANKISRRSKYLS